MCDDVSNWSLRTNTNNFSYLSLRFISGLNFNNVVRPEKIISQIYSKDLFKLSYVNELFKQFIIQFSLIFVPLTTKSQIVSSAANYILFLPLAYVTFSSSIVNSIVACGKPVHLPPFIFWPLNR
jgi:hypothetical protein